MVTPPQKDGLISPYTLAAAKLGGVDEIYMVGGAQAVAALAYGTETIPRVDKITGPGNAFVAAAKQIVSGDVGIDMVAGPSEVCVLADATAKPMVVAADLMAQAEHDPLAACYLVTCDEQFAREVEAGIDILVAQSPRAEITRASLDNEGTIVVAADMAAAVEAVNTVAPEHLELHCKDAMGLLGGIRNAGAIFVGAWSSEPLGDYVAGPNHTLPTGGTGHVRPTRFRSKNSLSARVSFAIHPRACSPTLPRRSAWPRPRACGRTRYPPLCVAACWSRARIP